MQTVIAVLAFLNRPNVKAALAALIGAIIERFAGPVDMVIKGMM